MNVLLDLARSRVGDNHMMLEDGKTVSPQLAILVGQSHARDYIFTSLSPLKHIIWSGSHPTLAFTILKFLEFSPQNATRFSPAPV